MFSTNITLFLKRKSCRDADAAPCPLTADDEMARHPAMCIHLLGVSAVMMNHVSAFGGG